ncbi:MAG: YbgC/FadM family acyl-CoA thioesterase [Sulfurimonas sp.]|uniref:YbgC/FadM family acyl-CoA thioesterase n=1 Tax=Sulfurimonas sp. TaxID=2022749 RepID=UPI002618B268|nr:YbgC/FadM family acyl-CoA thioesterase [Sulfurimonas sp.]MCW8894997.1 YbgC/FadM family acyl-CoA thioesterase [Sulfurimonas sp.]MCW8953639.1 YbgC/FadM family acyl-CoA thioesterase [Sulfurimonas sp.]MCW9066847.1 YbgC/FadM family acyl-CoA thioesterase [Sulfurimonas sp.]
MNIRVYYEDTDTGGVVYHSNYLNFCERARSDAFFERGLSPVLSSGHFVARKLEADFFSSAKLGDMLEVETKLIDMRAASFRLSQIIFKDAKKVFELNITLAYITFEGKPQKISSDVKELIKSIFAAG